MIKVKTIDVLFGDKRKDYQIDIGSNITSNLMTYINNNLKCQKVMIITDDIVADYYLKAFSHLFESSPYALYTMVVTAGEGSKSLEVAAEAYSRLAGAAFSRSDLLIAFGGGVIGDLGGYIAATYKRGIPFIQVPTTLLSQVDSSVGGKVAVNIPEGKNLIGAFYQPEYVLIDVDFLDTLKKDQWLDGLGEIIKYGFIGSKDLFDKLTAHTLASLKEGIIEIIETCCSIKRDVVVADEYDTGLRMTLNFGHTLGHAIEKHYGYGTYSHGQAIAMGMYLMMRQYEGDIGRKNGLTPVIEKILRQYDLYKEEIVKAYKAFYFDIINDKKLMNGQMNIIVVDKVGQARIYPLTLPQAKAMLEERV